LEQDSKQIQNTSTKSFKIKFKEYLFQTYTEKIINTHYTAIQQSDFSLINIFQEQLNNG